MFSNSKLIFFAIALYRTAFCRVLASFCEAKLCLCLKVNNKLLALSVTLSNLNGQKFAF